MWESRRFSTPAVRTFNPIFMAIFLVGSHWPVFSGLKIDASFQSMSENCPTLVWTSHTSINPNFESIVFSQVGNRATIYPNSAPFEEAGNNLFCHWWGLISQFRYLMVTSTINVQCAYQIDKLSDNNYLIWNVRIQMNIVN